MGKRSAAEAGQCDPQGSPVEGAAGSESGASPAPGTAAEGETAAPDPAEGERPAPGIAEGESPDLRTAERETPGTAEGQSPEPSTTEGELPAPGSAEGEPPDGPEAAAEHDATPEPLPTAEPVPDKETEREDEEAEESTTSPRASTSLLEGDDDDDDEEEDEDDDDEAEEQQEEAEPDEEEVARTELMERYRALVLERDKIHLQNGQLQHKLHDYFRRKKGDETARRGPPPDLEKQSLDHEQRYLRYMSTLGELRQLHAQESDRCHGQVEELRARCQKLVDEVGEEWRLYQSKKKAVALSVVAGKKGLQAAARELDELQAKEQLKEEALIQVRLENIKLKNRINRYEVTLKAKEELAEGLHLIDFEQLKIENQTYNEKIEERNEELLKLRKKITGTVQVLTHLKEKLQFVQAENQVKKEQLSEIEALVAQKRDVLTKTKQARDSLRIGNVKLRQKCGLLGNELLLRDFEDNVDATDELCQRLETLRRHHAELTLNCKGIKKKIDEAKCSQEPLKDPLCNNSNLSVT